MKKLFVLFLAVVMVLGMLAGCQTPDNPNPDKPGNDDPVVDNRVPTLDGGNTYEEGYPIVKTPVKLVCAMTDNGACGDYTVRSLWAYMKEMTNIDLELRLITSGGETVALIFATKEYPDISFRLDTTTANQLIAEAAQQGDLVELTDEMLTKYAPNVTSIFNQYPEIQRMSRHIDGKMYSLPQLDYIENAIDLRDCWFVNATYLDELGMEAPETLDDYTEYLRSVKAAAGSGSIPANVTPLYVRHYNNNGGWYSILDSHGLYNGLNDFIVVDGKVTHNALDSNLKRAMEYLAQLYSEELISDEGLGSDYATYCAACGQNGVKVTNWAVGSYFGYGNTNPDMIPIKNVTVDEDTPVYARQMGINNRLIANCFVIYNTCKYPYAALRYVDYFYSEEGSLRARYGEEGYFYEKTEDGTYVYTGKTWGQIPDSARGFENYGPNIIVPELDKQLSAANVKDPTTREYAFENLYKQQLPTDREIYPAPALNFLTVEESKQATATKNLLNTFLKTQTNKWIKNLDVVDDTWDTFQERLVDMGINDLIALYQKAYDAYIAE